MTEKDYNPEQRNAKAMQKQETAKIANAPIKKEIKDKKNIQDKKEQKNKKKPEKKIKKDESIVRGVSVPISTKDSVAICKFIKKKSIEKAIVDLGEVLKFKKAIPMKGESPHKKGKGMMAGRYPINAIQHFIRMLRTLGANSNMNGLEEPIIAEAVANKASRPYGRFGSVQRKRTHIKIIAREKTKMEKKKNNNRNKTNKNSGEFS